MELDDSFYDFFAVIKPEFIEADLENIQNTLPELYPEQQEDVQKAEQRFLNGKGILFTNGTGTGKTFVGLGIAKRFIKKGRSNVLIVVPTDKKAEDWVIEGRHLQLSLRKLDNIKDFRYGVSITTYTNFYQNEQLALIDFDLVIYDECHYLLQNALGQATEALAKHKALAKLPSHFDKLYGREIKGVCRSYCEHSKRHVLDNKQYKQRYNQRIKAYVAQTKVVFLSASPFAYHKSILLGDGCLWNIYEQPQLQQYVHRGYNVPDEYEQFFITHFGYRMRYNKLNIPDAAVDISLMERNFYEHYSKQGIISGRQIAVDCDYSREFIIINSDVGEKIDQGKALFSTSEFSERYPFLSRYVYRKFNYNYTNQLLECIKAKEVIPRIQAHLALGRKVVIFHNYNHSLPSHPFHFDTDTLLNNSEEMTKDGYGLFHDIQQFEQDYPELVNLDLSGLNNPRDTITNAFPKAAQFNGTISKKERAKHIDAFNDNDSDTNILLIQTKAGKEGISLHDTIGNVQRVLLTLALATAPTDAIQIEGRIYRIGIMSNAIYEYITLHTSFERLAFAYKIATRSRTAENLAIGEKARDLEIVFKEGYLNADDYLPHPEQGTGGKESDFTYHTISEFEKAKTYYFGMGKRTGSNRSREGTDYFATPEPLGFKIIEWLNLKPGHECLEPSAGHGAIARFFPENTTNLYIEPSYELSSRLAINVRGTIESIHFEDLSVENTFDRIAMNPPFGKQGKIAMAHIAKAVSHLKDTKGSRLIAIIPDGNAMEKRLDAYLESDIAEHIMLTHEIILPSIVFERAGTMIQTKLITLEYQSDAHYTNRIDLSYITDINMFFDRIEQLSI